jgi:hypothetical protein
VGLRTTTHFVGSPFDPHVPTGSRTHPWLYAAPFQGSKEEFIALLDAHGIEYDEKYLWD